MKLHAHITFVVIAHIAHFSLTFAQQFIDNPDIFGLHSFLHFLRPFVVNAAYLVGSEGVCEDDAGYKEFRQWYLLRTEAK